MAQESTNEKASRRPANTKFKQQKLKAWQPILTPKTVLPTFFVIGVVFIPLGAIFLVASKGVVEQEIKYTNCQGEVKGSTTDLQNCDTYWQNYFSTAQADLTSNADCVCYITFKIDERIPSTAYMYYGLDNYYQNHRRYVKSRDDLQLRGENVNSVSDDCDPIKTNGNLPYIPCGLVANSLFNDTISLAKGTATDSTAYNSLTSVSLDGNGIAWSSDKNDKFKNPDPVSSLSNGSKPPNWPVKITELFDGTDTWGHPNGLGFENEDFIVWMRTAGLPNFRKLYRKIESGLDAGDYTLKVQYNYPVTAFDGDKWIYLSDASWLGGKNDFLGVVYIVVGCIAFVLGFAFLARHLIKPRQLGDHRYLKWNQDTN
eukprot:Nk52_evm1s1649 gene=Nk52_evmTU1s1649